MSETTEACAVMSHFCARDIDDQIAFLSSRRQELADQANNPPPQDAILHDAFLSGAIVGYERSRKIIEQCSKTRWARGD